MICRYIGGSASKRSVAFCLHSGVEPFAHLSMRQRASERCAEVREVMALAIYIQIALVASSPLSHSVCQRSPQSLDLGWTVWCSSLRSTGWDSCGGSRKADQRRGNPSAQARNGANEKPPICGSLVGLRSQKWSCPDRLGRTHHPGAGAADRNCCRSGDRWLIRASSAGVAAADAGFTVGGRSAALGAALSTGRFGPGISGRSCFATLRSCAATSC